MRDSPARELGRERGFGPWEKEEKERKIGPVWAAGKRRKRKREIGLGWKERERKKGFPFSFKT